METPNVDRTFHVPTLLGFLFVVIKPPSDFPKTFKTFLPILAQLGPVSLFLSKSYGLKFKYEKNIGTESTIRQRKKYSFRICP